MGKSLRAVFCKPASNFACCDGPCHVDQLLRCLQLLCTDLCCSFVTFMDALSAQHAIQAGCGYSASGIRLTVRPAHPKAHRQQEGNVVQHYWPSIYRPKTTIKQPAQHAQHAQPQQRVQSAKHTPRCPRYAFHADQCAASLPCCHLLVPGLHNAIVLNMMHVCLVAQWLQPSLCCFSACHCRCSVSCPDSDVMLQCYKASSQLHIQRQSYSFGLARYHTSGTQTAGNAPSRFPQSPLSYQQNPQSSCTRHDNSPHD